MSYLDEVKEWNERQIAATKTSLDNWPNRAKVREEVAVAMDKATEGYKVEHSWIGSNMELTLSSVEEAREVTDKMLELLEINKADKNFEGWGSIPRWYYEMSYEHQAIKIWPAEPSADCVPVAKASASTYWVCERRE